MGSFFKPCACSRPNRCPHACTIRFRDARGKQREETGYRTQDAAVERLTEPYADRKKTAPSVAEARRGPGQQTTEEYARTWLPRQRRMTEYSTAKSLASHFKVQINPVIGSRKLNAVTPTVVEDFLDHLEAEGVGRGHQLNVYRALSALLRDAFEKGAIADDPPRGVQKPEYAPQRVVIPDAEYIAGVSIPSQYGDDPCGQSLGEGGSALAFVVDRVLEPAHAVWPAWWCRSR
ncbi:phage integrase SAM-like domain-containing protein [Streptomyces sp. M2CJ-2]|uniref:phage integrase SAM-like domain-containing protein n=1 Tax=Streptomyces sp. M2CJ-2 TaxID=2803948 RepID=UPI001925A273|nr:phage integrase SAM-like domain-containing protein [Streptomyces sp. M2CJ-2]MBL3670541.1 phage integrase SAM-like domain-containing protein [Streptomyces sp. M2CJ-2]